MPIIKKTAFVPYSTAQMFDLVNDIEAYPEFLSWCRTSEILSKNEDEIHATLELTGAGLSKKFTTHNHLQHNKMIEIRLVNGPFKHLEGFWRFEEVSEKACHIIFDLEFEFAAGLLGFALGPVFHQIANTLVDAFSQRAGVVYGTE